MESKCNLTLINNNFLKRKADKEAKEHEIADKQDSLQKLFKETSNLKQQIASQECELAERETTIRDKDKRIYDIKKKT